jgi:beta-lactam-binding protein with PASTA domain
MSEQQAKALLAAPPYSYFVTVQQGTGPGQVGTVFATSPAAGSTLAPGSGIVIYVVQAASTSPSPPPTTPPTSPSPTATP